MLKQFFGQRLIVGTVVFLLCLIAGGIVYLKRLERQTQREIAETAASVKSLMPAQAETQTASAVEVIEAQAGDGHVHADGTWHAEPHAPALEVGDAPVEDYVDEAFAAYEASLSHFTEEERATYGRALRGEIVRHSEKYPDCQDHEAVFEDADRFSRWYVKYKAYRKKHEALYAEWKKVMFENDELYENLRFNMSPEERRQYIENMSEAERAALTTRLETWQARKDAASKRYDEFKKEEPIEPKRRHTH